MIKLLTAALTFFLIAGCKTKSMEQSNLTSYAFRLKPGEDVKSGIEKVVKDNNIKAGWMVTCVGSLTDYTIRFANQPEGNSGRGHFEIVSLVGTISVNGLHLHICLSDSTGKTIGGHLMPGCKVYTTAEIVLQATDKYEFTREKDGTTPWEELQVIPK
jgi:uncharacterized protein